MARRSKKRPVRQDAAEIARRVLRGSEVREWQPVRIEFPQPPAEPAKAYRCAACRRLEVEACWRCLGCGRTLCEHAMRVQRVDGSGYCRRCAYARVRRFNERFGLSAVRPPPEEATLAREAA